MAQNPVRVKGSIRWVQQDPADVIVPGSNSGMFASVVRQVSGVSLVTLDDEFRLRPHDVISPHCEGNPGGMRSISVVRESETQIRVFSFADTGFTQDAEIALSIEGHDPTEETATG